MKLILCVLVLCSGLFAPGTSAQAPESTDASPQVLALVKQLQAQEAAIAENQAKIDSKIALVAEAVRVARIYSSRGGR